MKIKQMAIKGLFIATSLILILNASALHSTSLKIKQKTPAKISGDFSKSYAAVEDDNGKWGIIDNKGNYIIKPKFDIMPGFFSGSLVTVGEKTKDGFKFGVINRLGEYVIDPKFDDIADFPKNLLFVRNKGKCALIDYTGKYVFGPVEIIGPFSEGLAKVQDKGKWGFVNSSGKYAIQPQFDGVGDSFSKGLIEAETNGKWGFIDRSGKYVIEPKFDEVLFFNYNKGLATVKYKGKYGVINRSGKYIIEPKFKDLSVFSENIP